MRALAALVLAVVALAGCGGDDEAASSVQDLSRLDVLRSDFESHAGTTRVVLLVAPT